MNKTIIQTPTPDLEKSNDYYSRLGFKKLSDEPVLFTDGKFILEINPERTARAGLKIYSDDWSKTVSKLREMTSLIETENGFLASDPNCVWVYLVEGNLEHDTGEKSFGATGNFSGISIEAVDVERTVAFWEAVGFEKGMGDMSQGWAVYSNGSDIDVSIMKTGMCPHLFFNPGLTFFNSGKNLDNIAKLREADIPITEEITCFNKEGIVDNVIINDPGGLGFFVFND